MSDGNLWNKFLGWLYPKLVRHMWQRGFGDLWMISTIQKAALKAASPEPSTRGPNHPHDV